jgi:hypothetical protein
VHGLDYWVHRIFSYPQTGLYSVYSDPGTGTNGELIRILDYKNGIEKMNVIYDNQYPQMVDKNK